MLLPFVLFALGVEEPKVADVSVTLCNDMKVRLQEAQLSTSGEGPGWHSQKPGDHGFEVSALAPGASAIAVGACVSGVLPPGDYILSFIEIGDHGETAMCRRPVTVKGHDIIRISPDDGAQCVQ